MVALYHLCDSSPDVRQSSLCSVSGHANFADDWECAQISVKLPANDHDRRRVVVRVLLTHHRSRSKIANGCLCSSVPPSVNTRRFAWV